MDGDARDQPTDSPKGGSDWSIEDFDDFSAFEDLATEDLATEADAGAPRQLDFDETSDVGEASPLPIDEAPAPEDEAADGPAGEPTDLESTVERAAAGATDDAAEGTSGVTDSGPTLGFETPMEPEASMERTARSPKREVADPVAEVFDLDDAPDFSTFTQEHYVQATTQEYAGLAESMARAAEVEAEPMAVSAGFPGLESGVVGLEDVLEGADDAGLAVAGRSGSDLSVRVLTAVALISLLFGSLYQDYLVAILIFAVMFIAAVELYVVLVRVGHRPMTLLGLAGVGGALFGTWYWGPIAIPIALILTTVATLVFFGVVAHRREPLIDTALTVLVLAWIGGLGSLAMDIAWAPDFAWMIAAVVVVTALMDVAQYFIGRRFGKRQLAPMVSPKKTVEGLVGGVAVAIAVGAGFGTLGPFELSDGLIIGALVAIVAPFGDLAVSVVKRAIGVKDMGAILPGHGGVLDRIDAMVFVIPAAWVAYSWMGLIA